MYSVCSVVRVPTNGQIDTREYLMVTYSAVGLIFGMLDDLVSAYSRQVLGGRGFG